MTEDPDVRTFDAEVEKAWTEFAHSLVGRLEALEEGLTQRETVM